MLPEGSCPKGRVFGSFNRGVFVVSGDHFWVRTSVLFVFNVFSDPGHPDSPTYRYPKDPRRCQKGALWEFFAHREGPV